MTRYALVLAWLAATASPAGAVAASSSPNAIGVVAPDVIALTVRTGRVEPGRDVPYQRAEGDTVQTWDRQTWVARDGKPLGGPVGKGGTLVHTFDRVVGDRLDTARAAQPAAYAVASPDDPHFRTPQQPAAVYRKSKPSDLARTGPWEFDAAVTHVLYLRLAKPMKVGCRYRVTCPLPLAAAREFVFDPSRLRSEAVHVTHLGLRPDDPVKVAFLSCWMGTGGGLAYEAGTPFHVVDAATGTPAFHGKIVLRKAADDLTEDAYKRNYALTNVYEMDFSALRRPGTYRVMVDGVGCSWPVEMNHDVWRRAFLVSAKGFYHQRSGIALAPPYTRFRRPRCFHPDDGLKVYQSTCPLMDSGNGLNARGSDKNNFGNLVAGKTGSIVPNAWGGYFDAGDWDRRIQHLQATRLLLELAIMHPGFVAGLDFDIPESGNGVPDIVDESLWNLDCYRRLQTAEGGVRGGIESAEHPLYGEGSWQESLDVMAYAPGMWSSYVYAGDAARAARVLESLGMADRAATYRDSALRAMRWAEPRFDKHGYAKLPHQVVDARNLAAAELWRLTGDATWHDVFLATTVFRDPGKDLYKWQSHDQGDAAFVYTTAKRNGHDAPVLANCRAALLRAADVAAAMGGRSAFGYIRETEWHPFWGLIGAPRAIQVIRAHYLTGDPKYVRAAVLACQCGAGANPDNLCYTTGLGHKGPRHPLVVDQRMTGQAPPPGMTLFGPLDLKGKEDHWAVKALRPFCTPPPETWPTAEAFFDVYYFPEVCEFTIHTNLGPNAYAWGYLAARK